MALLSRLRTLLAQIEDAWRRRAVGVKAVSFALVGVVNTIVDYTVFLSARAVLVASPGAQAFFSSLSNACHCAAPASLTLVASNIMSWCVAVTGSYLMNSSFTFAAETSRVFDWRRYLTFVVSMVAGLIVNTAVLVFSAQMLSLPVWLAKAVAILIGFFVNFSLSHFIVFRARPETGRDLPT